MKGKEALSAPERMREVRKRKQEAGWKQVNIWLSPAAQLAIKLCAERLEMRGYKPTQNEIVNECIVGNHPLDNKEA